MSDHWHAVSKAAIQDLEVLAGQDVHSDDDVSAAADRLLVLLGSLASLDTPHEEAGVLDAIMYYIGYRHGRTLRSLPFRHRQRDLQLPAAHIMDLITRDKTLAQVTAEVDEEIP